MQFHNRNGCTRVSYTGVRGTVPAGVLHTPSGPLAPDKGNLEPLTHLTHAIEVSVVKDTVAAYSLGKPLSTHLRDLIGYNQDDR